jgi:intein-encoded DNA endonuclease-like protein
MLNNEEELILRFLGQGKTATQISRILGISRLRVNDFCVAYYAGFGRLPNHLSPISNQAIFTLLKGEKSLEMHKAYAYLLGIYLGDGNISRNRKIYRLRVTLDKRYPNVINACIVAIQTVLPANRVGIVQLEGCVDVSCFYKHWPNLLPQHGEGRKHEREIKLEDWQQDIVQTYPLEFFRGLYHSDGSRFSNIVNGKDYPRYQFSNSSNDIRRLFCDTCDRLDLHWTENLGKKTRCKEIFISKRKDVEFLDRTVGPKS